MYMGSIMAILIVIILENINTYRIYRLLDFVHQYSGQFTCLNNVIHNLKYLNVASPYFSLCKVIDNAQLAR